MAQSTQYSLLGLRAYVGAINCSLYNCVQHLNERETGFKAQKIKSKNKKRLLDSYVTR